MNLSELTKRYLPYLALLGIAAVAFFQVVFGRNPMMYDMIDCYYPWRFHIGECLQNGIFPYWNPYQDLGYPIHADPSSGAWYPLVWLLGSTVGYTVYTIGFEFFFHVFLGGVGMFILARTLKIHSRIAFIAAVSYMLCGIFVGNAQHLTYVVSAAWIPFVLNFYFKMIHDPNGRNAVFAGFFLFLMMTGGYPAFVIILFYFMLITAFINFWKAWKSEKFRGILKILRVHMIFVFSALLLASGILISVWQVSPYLSRLEGFSIEQVLYSPFGPKAFLSLVAPFSTVKFPEFFGGDISMNNGYFGIIMLIFFGAGLLTVKSFEFKLLFFLALFSLTAAVGDALPVREFLFRYVPMMGVFRFPSVFRLFFILPFILLAANFLNQMLLKEKPLSFRKWRFPLLGIITLFLGIILILRGKTSLWIPQFLKTVVLDQSEESIIQQHIAFQLLIQVVLLTCFLIVIWRIRNWKHQLKWITGIVVVDLLISTQLNAPYTVYYPQISSKQAHNAVASYPKGFPELSNISIAESNNLPSPGTPYWQNYHCFMKQVTAEGFNSFSFGSYEDLESQYPFIYAEFQKNHLLLLSDQVYLDQEMIKTDQDSSYRSDMLFFDRADRAALIKQELHHDNSDTAMIRSYSANHFEIKALTKNSQLLTLFQKYYDGWEARLDGKKVPVYKSNMNFMTVVLPAGAHKIEFTYRNGAVRIAFMVSILGAVIVLILLLGSAFCSSSALKSTPVS